MREKYQQEIADGVSYLYVAFCAVVMVLNAPWVWLGIGVGVFSVVFAWHACRALRERSQRKSAASANENQSSSDRTCTR